MLDNTQAVVAITGSGIAILAALAGWLRWVRPKLKKTAGEVVAIRDSILGRDPIVDTITGREIEPALPGIGVRMASNEKQLGVLANAVAQIAHSHAQLENHEDRISRLEAGAVERVVTKAESAAAWRAMEAIAHDPDRIEDEGRGTE
jgi:hypothetical protein